MKKTLLFVMMGSVFSLSAHEHCCGHHHHEEEAAAFHWTKEKSALAQVELKAAGPGVIQNFVRAPGKITIHPNLIAYINPKVEGVVSQIRKNIGEKVEKGEIIALIESKEIAEAKAAYLAATKKWELQQRLLNRESVLRGISAGQDYFNAQLAAEEAAIHKELTLQNLYALGLVEEEIASISQQRPEELRLFPIKSPLKGKVVERELTLGEMVCHTTKAFTVANFEKLWLEISVHPQDVQYLKVGQPLEIVAQDKKSQVKIQQIQPTINEETRTATAIGVLDNRGALWRPGEFVSAQIVASVTPVALVVPREAIQIIDGNEVIFVEQEECLTPCAVKLGRMDEKNVEILSGLQLGQAYASCNTFCIKADYEKEEVEHHH